ncbi:MAG: hypothetical protein HYZ95_03240 [Candidatus Omnitrophica bacterium]|nr:hypothetical protein [Candidatus Omnitrophota bacterium]
MTDRILLVAAVPVELSGVPRGGSTPVRLLAAGVGPKAGRAVRRHLDRERFSLVVSTGFSGGARPGLKPGDLVWASEVIRAGSGWRRAPTGDNRGLNGLCSVGPFVTVNRPLQRPQEKREMGLRYGAVAVDMESADVAEAAEQAGVPWVALRVILDPVDAPLLIGDGRQALGTLLRPWRWKEMAAFFSEVRRSSLSLGRGLNEWVERIKKSQ